LKLLEGNAGKRPLPKNEPHPRPVLPDAPPYLGEIARVRWDELLPELDYSGVLTRVDGDVFACYCEAYESVVVLSAFIRETGRTYQLGDKGAVAPYPEVAMLARAKDDLRRFGAELGIGAASRTKIETRKPNAGKSTLTLVREKTRRR
jgi:P27 family predicted phage terminase small subunit